MKAFARLSIPLGPPSTLRPRYFPSILTIMTAQSATMATSSLNEPTFDSVGVRNRNIKTAAGVALTPQQEVLIGSVLDLFEGHPSLKHLALWNPEGSFQDPIAVALGYKKFAAQWYGLPAAFNPIAIQSHEVLSAGKRISFSLQNKYVVKGLKAEKIMDSVVNVHVGDDGKIEMVEDRWNDKLPDGPISLAFRKLNGVSMPLLIKVPQTAEEDEKMAKDRGDVPV